MNSTSGMIVYLVFIIAIFYFMAIRPQSKEKKKQAELMATVAVGDSVLTSSGFYGVIIDMTDDTGALISLTVCTRPGMDATAMYTRTMAN